MTQEIKTPEQILADNQAFLAMSPADKRIRIAKDVLEHLESRRMVAKHQAWLGVPGNTCGVLVRSDKVAALGGVEALNQDLREILTKLPPCEACALGGMFMCAVERMDALKLGDLPLDGGGSVMLWEKDIQRYLGDFFSKEHLELIEIAFERGEGSNIIDDYDEDDPALDGWMAASAYTDISGVYGATARMALVMLNIIRNGGRFMPELPPTDQEINEARRLTMIVVQSTWP